MKPAVGSDDTGFSSHVGDFDSLLDTISNERPSNAFLDLDDDSYGVSGSRTLSLLESRHNCHK